MLKNKENDFLKTKISELENKISVLSTPEKKRNNEKKSTKPSCHERCKSEDYERGYSNNSKISNKSKYEALLKSKEFFSFFLVYY